MVKIVKQLIMKSIKFFYWKYRNFTEGLMIYNYNLSPKNKLGKKTRIGKGIEFGNITLGDYSAISGPRSYIEEAKIGKHCSIARQVVIGVTGHNYDWVTTSEIITDKKLGFINNNVSHIQKPMPEIGNDVWIGINSIIMRGVIIGDGAVVGAGSVVTSNVLPYSIVGGIPAKHIRFRFTEDQIKKLLKVKWWDWDENKKKKNSYLFYDIEKFLLTHYNE